MGRPIPCEELACGDQNRVCEVVSVLENRCGKCQAGFVEQAGVCVEPAIATCESLQCAQQGRQCVAPEGSDAVCTDCLADLIEEEGAIVALPPTIRCEELACYAQNRACEKNQRSRKPHAPSVELQRSGTLCWAGRALRFSSGGFRAAAATTTLVVPASSKAPPPQDYTERFHEPSSHVNACF